MCACEYLQVMYVYSGIEVLQAPAPLVLSL